MVVLMALILVFNADFYTLVNRDRVERIQMKYTLILQKYLRYQHILCNKLVSLLGVNAPQM